MDFKAVWDVFFTIAMVIEIAVGLYYLLGITIERDDD